MTDPNERRIAHRRTAQAGLGVGRGARQATGAGIIAPLNQPPALGRPIGTFPGTNPPISNGGNRQSNPRFNRTFGDTGGLPTNFGEGGNKQSDPRFNRTFGDTSPLGNRPVHLGRPDTAPGYTAGPGVAPKPAPPAGTAQSAAGGGIYTDSTGKTTTLGKKMQAAGYTATQWAGMPLDARKAAMTAGWGKEMPGGIKPKGTPPAPPAPAPVARKLNSTLGAARSGLTKQVR